MGTITDKANEAESEALNNKHSIAELMDILFFKISKVHKLNKLDRPCSLCRKYFELKTDLENRNYI